MRGSRRSPRICSGDMCDTVPSTLPVAVSCSLYSAGGQCRQINVRRIVDGADLCQSKIENLGVPARVTNRFAGLMSRWVIPAECAASKPSAISMASGSSVSIGIGLPRIRCFSVVPSRNSMTMNDRFSCRSISYIVQMFGWFRDEAARASRAKSLDRVWISRPILPAGTSGPRSGPIQGPRPCRPRPFRPRRVFR